MSELEPERLDLAIAALSGGGTDPAGGPVAAAVAALAAGLAAAAADRSRRDWDEAAGARAQAEALRRRMLALAERDAAAYADARAALAQRAGQGGQSGQSGQGHGGQGGQGGQGEGGEQGRGDDAAVRDARLGEAVRLAALAPLQIGARACDVAELAAAIARHGAPEVQADAAIAAILAAAAARAAAHLVEINLVAGADAELVAQARDCARAAASAAGSVAR